MSRRQNGAHVVPCQSQVGGYSEDDRDRSSSEAGFRSRNTKLRMRRVEVGFSFWDVPGAGIINAPAPSILTARRKSPLARISWLPVPRIEVHLAKLRDVELEKPDESGKLQS